MAAEGTADDLDQDSRKPARGPLLERLARRGRAAPRYRAGEEIGRGGILVVAGIGTNVRAYRTTPSFQSPFCFGDGTGTACPCGNAGSAGRGCANSVQAAGGRLVASGAASLANDTLVLRGDGMPNAAALYFQGTQAVSAVFGDGVRCAGGTIVRLGTRNTTTGAVSFGFGIPGDPAISVQGGVPLLGATRWYQVSYRNSVPFCTPATFNLSNALEVYWAP